MWCKTIIIGIVCLLFTGCLGQSGENQKITSSVEKPLGDELENLGLAPDFTLINQDGQKIALSDVRGKVVLIYFIYTKCPDFCPTHTTRMVQLQRALGGSFGKDVYFITISFDPENDTPDVLKSYAEKFKVDLSGWAFVTGTQEEIDSVSEAYGISTIKDAEIDEIAHTSFTTLVDTEGMVRKQYFGLLWENVEALSDIESLLGENS